MCPPMYHSGDTELDRDIEYPPGILAMPPSSSIARRASPAPGHRQHPAANPDDPTHSGHSKSATLPASLSAGTARQFKSIPNAFLRHHTPFATVKYVPPSDASGYTGEGGWDTGGLGRRGCKRSHKEQSEDAAEEDFEGNEACWAKKEDRRSVE